MTREEAIKDLNTKSCFGCRYGFKTVFDCEYNKECEHRNAVIMAIKALEQEPKTGHWIEHIKRDEFDDYEEEFYKCSECGIEDCYKFAYCPNCGARMSEVSE